MKKEKITLYSYKLELFTTLNEIIKRSVIFLLH